MFKEDDEDDERADEVGCVDVYGAKGAKVLAVVTETGGIFGG